MSKVSNNLEGRTPMTPAKEFRYGLKPDEVRKAVEMYTMCRDTLNKFELEFDPRQLMKETIITILMERTENNGAIPIRSKAGRKARPKVTPSQLALEG
jgi:hypothetical protein